MDRLERIVTLHRLLKQSRYPIPQQRLSEELGCSRATVYRDIAYLRDALGAPVESDAEQSGFAYARGEADSFELPGLWLSSEELHALLTMQQLLTRTSPGLLAPALSPLRGRIEKLLANQTTNRQWPLERIRVIGSGVRDVDEAAFRNVATAVLERQRLRFRYRARTSDQDTLRTVSPQRLTRYRDNWYLDAFDHEREALRSFALDRVREATILEERAQDLPEAELDAHLGGGYGIFSGPAKAWATIVFSERAARWVADEHWHSRQEGRRLTDGRYELRIPYSNGRELIMDVLRYGPDAEITAPPALREEIKILLGLALSGYKTSTLV